MKTIIKVVRHEHGFTVINNDVVRDRTLSFRARGILAMVLSHSDEWVTTHAWIEEQGTEGREAVRTALKELEAAGHLVTGEYRIAGRFMGHTMTWHEIPLSVDTETGPPPEDRKTASRLPARKKEQGEQKKIIKTSPRKSGPPAEKPQYDIGVQAARSVELDILAPEGLRPIWKQYQDYRTERHYTKGPDRLAWTETAARAAAESVNRAILAHGEQMVADRILTAVEKRWQGLNMNTLGEPYGTSHQQTGGRKFEALKGGKTGQHGAEFTGEIR